MTAEPGGPLTVLGIETSCDETAAAVVRRGPDGAPEILAEALLSQIADHRPYEGVVPEIAARAHIDHLDVLIGRAMASAGLDFHELDGVAATAGPGLIGGVMVGATMGKAIAAAAGKPFLAVNHLEGHALSACMTGQAAFPFLLLLVSGGHCQLLLVRGVGRYRLLGTTVDDAVGEAFDKVARLLGLGYPGGPAVEAAAERARDPDRFDLPRPMRGRPGCDFSFSGLKTAVLTTGCTRSDTPPDPDAAADIAAAFQNAVADVLTERTGNGLAMAREREPGLRRLVVAGGVAANRRLCRALEDLCARKGLDLSVPPQRYCTDNAAMIAWAGAERLALGLTSPLDFAPRPRWPLESPEDPTPAAPRIASDGSTSREVRNGMNRIAVIGAGAWGTALAMTAARAGCTVGLWARETRGRRGDPARPAQRPVPAGLPDRRGCRSDRRPRGGRWRKRNWPCWQRRPSMSLRWPTGSPPCRDVRRSQSAPRGSSGRAGVL